MGKPGMRLNTPSIKLIWARYEKSAPCSIPRAHRQDKEQERKGKKARKRASRRNPEFGLWAWRLSLHLGNASKNEERDALNGKLIFPGDKRMGKLMKDNGGKKEHRCQPPLIQ